MNTIRSTVFARSLAAALTLGAAVAAQAAHVNVTIHVENLAPAQGVAIAPLNFGFNNGSFDAFNLGQKAATPISRIAEMGNGSAWQQAFALADATATRGTVGGVLLAGGSASQTVMVDTALNPYFTFAAMVVPSNDFFIGNDSPTRFRVFDNAGHLAINQINQKARDIWDAGSEAFDPASAAFVGNAGLHTDENGVVTFNYAELAGYNGLHTAAGYDFHSGLMADTDIYRISFSVNPVPEPETYALMLAGLGAMGWVARRSRAAAA